MTNEAESKTQGAKHEFAALNPTLEISPFGEFNSRNLTAVAKANAAILQGATSYWTNFGGFIGKRLKCDAEFMRELAACRNGEDAVRAQHRFITSMISEYANEMHRLLSIGADTAKNVAEPIEERAEEAFHSMEARNKDKDAA